MPAFDTLGVQYDPQGNPISGDTGVAVPAGAMFIAGTDGTNLRGLLTDATGKLQATFTASDNTGTGALAALNNNVQVTLTAEAGAGFELDAGTLIGTIVPEVSYDGGTNWVQTFFEDPSTGNKVASIVFSVANTLQQRSIYTPGGAGLARVRVSAFTSGTATAHLRATTIDNPMMLSEGASGALAPPVTTQVGGLNAGNLIATAVDAAGRTNVVGPAAPGGAPVGNPVYVAGTDGANLRAILTDATGASVVVGNVANGSAATGNPVTVAGVDAAGNVRRFLTDTTGRLVMIDEKAGTSAVTRVATSTANVQLLAANTSRLGATIVNDATVTMFLKLGVTASNTSYTVLLAAKGYFEVPFDYTGEIDAILSSSTGNAQITELTP
jgi:hypothetical protein